MITKAFFSKLLKEVCDEVLRPSVIIGSFSTCGYFPFSFPLSYAFKQMLPLPGLPPHMIEEEEVVVVINKEVEVNQDETVLTVVLASVGRSSHSTTCCKYPE